MNQVGFSKINLAGMSVDQALAAVHPFAVVEAPIFGQFGEGESKIIPHQKGIFAVPNDSPTLESAIPLGTVGSDYKTIQFAEAAREAIGYLLDNGLISPISGGYFQGVRAAWLQCEVPDSDVEISTNFPVKHYVNFFKGFVGNYTIKFNNGGICVVCANTCYAARTGKHSDLDLSVRHTTNAIANIQVQSKALNEAVAAHGEMLDQYRQFAAKKISFTSMREYITDAITMGEFKDTDSDKMSTRAKNTVKTVIDLLDSPISVSGEARGTVWHAFNAVTEYLSHSYGHDEGSRFEAIHLGAGRRLGERAAMKAMEML